MFFGREQIKGDHHIQERIVSLFYGREQIRKSYLVNECSTEKSESKILHKSTNTNKVKDAIDETKDKETLVTDNPVTNELIYFNLFECGKKFLNNINATCEQACMEASKDEYCFGNT